MSLPIAFAASLLTFVVLDAAWLMLVGIGQFQAQIGPILRPQPNLMAAAAFYVIYASGLVFLAVRPALQQRSLGVAATNGAVLGLTAYATFDLTNLAVIKGWTLGLAAARHGLGHRPVVCRSGGRLRGRQTAHGAGELAPRLHRRPRTRARRRHASGRRYSCDPKLRTLFVTPFGGGIWCARMDDAKANTARSAAPVSERIRRRIGASGRRFHANDNIADFIEPGEIEELLDEVAAKMKGVLESLVIDIDNDHNTQGSARRVAKMYINEVFRGRYHTRRRSPSFRMRRASTS